MVRERDWTVTRRPFSTIALTVSAGVRKRFSIPLPVQQDGPQQIPPSGQVAQVGLLLVFVVDIEEDHAVVVHLAAGAAVLQLLRLLAALFAPVVDEPVVVPADVFFQPAPV